MHRLLVRWHMLVAAFLFPPILLYLLTGALYTWGAKGDYVTSDHVVTLSAPLTDDKAALKPAREFSMEAALEYIEDDELVEITPKAIRLRKKSRTETDRKRASRAA